MPSFDDAAVSEAIAARNRQFEQAYAAGDAKRLVDAYFVSDALEPLASPPGGQTPRRGRAELVAMFDSMFPSAPGIRLEQVSLLSSQDLAFELGRAFLDLAGGGQAIGRFTVCWVREAGEWRAKTDFFAEDGWAD
jgi:ketosteroid isomerase-like protein